MTGEVKFEKPVVVQQTETPVTPANPQKAGDARLSEALSASSEKPEEVDDQQNQPPKLAPKDFNVFPDDVKDNAYNEASDTLTEVQIAYNRYNSGSYNKMSIDYTSFPNPNDFCMKERPNKNKDGYDMYITALKNWDKLQMSNLATAESNEQNRRYNTVMNALALIYGAEIKSAEGVKELIEKYFNGTIKSLDELKEAVNRIQNGVNSANHKLDNIDTRTADIKEEVESTQAVVLDMNQTTNEIKNDTETLVKNDEEEKEKDNLRKQIIVATNNNSDAVFSKLSALIQSEGKRFDKFHSINPQIGNEERMQIIIGIVDTLTLEELRELREQLKDPSDPLVH